MQGLGFAAFQGDRDPKVLSPQLHHADPAIPGPIDQSVAEGPCPLLPRRCQLAWRTDRHHLLPWFQPRRQIQSPKTTITVIDEHRDRAVHREGAAAVGMDAATQVPRAGGEVQGGRTPYPAAHQGGATVLLGTLFQPKKASLGQ